MKNITLTIIICVVTMINVVAQGISGGIKGGLNIANQKVTAELSGFKISVTGDPRLAFHLGGYLNIPFSEKFSFQPELLYNSVGAKNEEDDDESISRVNYLSIPLMFKFNPVPVFNLQAGPQVGFLLSAKDELNGEEVDSKDSYNGFDFGLALGAGVDLPMGLNYSVRYVFGLANIVDQDDIDIDGAEFTGKNNVIQLSMGYRLFGASK